MNLERTGNIETEANELLHRNEIDWCSDLSSCSKPSSSHVQNHVQNYDNYAEIMHSTNALNRNNDESATKPKATKRWKWKHILKPIWNEKDLYTENGITPSVPIIILPCYPITLLER